MCINADNTSSGNATKVSTVFGVAGTIRLLAGESFYLSIFYFLVSSKLDPSLCLGTYLFVITSREEAGTFLGFPIFRVTAMKFLPCNGNLRFATAQEVSLFFFCKVSIFGVFFFKVVWNAFGGLCRKRTKRISGLCYRHLRLPQDCIFHMRQI